ncbi:DNA topoisomerase family protein [Bowmanella dokdonensis]|uniref:Topoisomerase DNA-binding C4 zinc finger domain-containing protein n=1 Tax=Bowmanella dokdonensis TaxID=751969 RepID=A0A939IRW3_9ALTE|nr:topoisomerase DNA-binding C4 zinc finger domain-containing protein [Bowmanella dokdonensis]MBN7825901.1 topoisomerase DNA-binding C4 zinc finger domain-containing protein [Bowmanella dokdonensis]
MSKIDHSLFKADEHALQHAYGDCPQCQAKLQIRSGKSGPFLGCSGYPDCHFSKPLHEYQYQEVKVIEGSRCPHCQSSMAVKKGRYGLFIGCTNFPECHHVDKLEQPQESSITCPACEKGHLQKRTNRFGKTFYACDQYPQCRYLLNQPPVQHACPVCKWPLMINKGGIMQCPQRGCQHKLSSD